MPPQNLLTTHFNLRILSSDFFLDHINVKYMTCCVHNFQGKLLDGENFKVFSLYVKMKIEGSFEFFYMWHGKDDFNIKFNEEIIVNK